MGIYEDNDYSSKSYDQVKIWLEDNIGAPANSRDLTLETWSPSISKATQGQVPRGIYFAKEEDLLAFLLSFGLPRRLK
jgi:hypothetical protein